MVHCLLLYFLFSITGKKSSILIINLTCVFYHPGTAKKTKPKKQWWLLYYVHGDCGYFGCHIWVYYQGNIKTQVRLHQKLTSSICRLHAFNRMILFFLCKDEVLVCVSLFISSKNNRFCTLVYYVYICRSFLAFDALPYHRAQHSVWKAMK